MNRQQDIEKLATKVMGWYKEEINTDWWWVSEHDPKLEHKDYSFTQAGIHTWNPFESWNDAGMLLQPSIEHEQSDEFIAKIMFICDIYPQDTADVAAFKLLSRICPNAIAEAALKVCDG